MFGFSSFAQDTFASSGSGPVSVTVDATGVVGTLTLGNETTSFDMVFDVTGFNLQTSLGTPLVFEGTTATITPLNALQSSLGSVTVFTGMFVNVNNTNLLMTAELGNANAELPILINATSPGALSANLGQETVIAGSVTVTPRQDETFNVTVANGGSGNVYYINYFKQTTLDSLHPPFTYRFDLSDSSVGGHPLRFSTTPDGTHGGGTEYTTGVTVNGNPGNPGAYVEITLADNTPQLYVYCANHSGMGFELDQDYNAEIIGTTQLNSVIIQSSVFIQVTNAGLDTFAEIADASTIIVSGSALVSPTGVSATGFISSSDPAVNVWAVINDSQTPGWTEIAA